ncbi:response regulator [Delftia lacustris]|uniref:response regulator n=1 Tax=Delftia lacustris TaxID=558537 RepID=UPI0035A73F53
MSSVPVVLFVDDEERIVKLFRMMFRATYQVETATSGKEALEIIAKQRVDLVVSDQRMPGMMGIELLAEVRRRSPSTMRILLTGYSDLAAIVGSVNEAEVFRFINKPWDHDKIKKVIAEAVEIARNTADAVQNVSLASAETAPKSGSAATKFREVLVLDVPDQSRAETVDILSEKYIVHTASSVSEALEVLQENAIGVLISEVALKNEDLSRFLSVLKQHYPVVVTLVMTSISDVDTVTELINKAQIYRFLPKPKRPNVLMLAVSGAMKQHFHYINNPKLMTRNGVSISNNSENEAFAAGISKYLKAIRSKFSFFK